MITYWNWNSNGVNYCTNTLDKSKLRSDECIHYGDRKSSLGLKVVVAYRRVIDKQVTCSLFSN